VPGGYSSSGGYPSSGGHSHSRGRNGDPPGSLDGPSLGGGSLSSRGSAAGKVTARMAHHAADALGLLLPGHKAHVAADSAEAAIVAAAVAVASASAAATAAGDKGGVPLWAEVHPAGGPLRVDCAAVPPGCFFFANHGAALACLLRLARRLPTAKAWVRESLPGLVARAVRCPLRAHTRASRASLYLLCSLAPDFRQALGQCHCVEAVLRSLVAEAALAATVIQLAVRKKAAQAARAAREGAAGQAAAAAARDASAAKTALRLAELRRARWAREKAARAALKASGSGAAFVEATPDEEAAADAADAALVAAEAEDEARNGKKGGEKGSKQGGKEKRRKDSNPFEQRTKLMSQFHRAHTHEQ
jgi:hypothetical protein